MTKLTPELEQEIRSKINPQYADLKGTESWERKLLLDEIDRLRVELKMNVKHFRDSSPTHNKSIAFVSPVETDRWEIGWKDWHCIRVEGGPSYQENELTWWFLLPSIPNTMQK